MKRLPGIILILVLSSLTLAEKAENNLYLYDSLDLNLDVRGELELFKESEAGSVKELTAKLLLYPKNDFRQTVLELNTNGEVQEDEITYTWKDGTTGTKTYQYSALIKTINSRNPIKEKISFPIKNLEEPVKKYLLPSETIDSDHPVIISRATELAEGEDDLFKVVFNLASWVEENVNYELNTLTAGASQKASWVLKNKQGVCDEITSLFVAMCRSLGIPARFVSGISYTTLELFAQSWQPHGWAEVYFPERGWVSFDLTFGEYGYIDVTHIKLREGLDPAEPSTHYEWLANKANLKAKELEFDITLMNRGKIQPEEILIEPELLAEEVSAGSYNLIKGIIKNNADHYTATTLKLAVPAELEIIGNNKRVIMLHPKEVRETFWILKIPDNLEEKYIYTFPAVIYSEKNVSASNEFVVQTGKSYYSKNEIEELTVKNEEKSYSRKISFTCNYSKEIKLNETAEFSCEIKNSGNTNLRQINFCFGKICEIIDLPINQMKSTKIIVTAENIGWNKIILSAENDQIEKKSSLEYLVLDDPLVYLNLKYPAKVKYGEQIKINLSLEKKSINEPQKVVVLVESSGWENRWELEKLVDQENFQLELNQAKLCSKNKFLVTALWKDQEGKVYSHQEEIIIFGEANNLADRIKMWFNGVLNWLA